MFLKGKKKREKKRNKKKKEEKEIIRNVSVREVVRMERKTQRSFETLEK